MAKSTRTAESRGSSGGTLGPRTRGRTFQSGSSPRGARRKRRAIGTSLRDRTQCRFCREEVSYIDYKDVDTLSKLLTNRGKIFSRKRSGNCAGCQRKVQKALKRARYMALLPFTS